jgi:hypothetical protein
MGDVDLTRGKDREYLRRAIANGWGITPDKMKLYAEALEEALDHAKAMKDPREIRGCVDTAVKMVSQIQADEHLDIKERNAMERAGQTINVNARVENATTENTIAAILSDPKMYELAAKLASNGDKPNDD